MPPFSNDFRRLAWSNFAAQSAEQIALVAAPIVAVMMLGAGEVGAGLLQVALTLPFLLVAIPAGLLADRVSRPRLMACAEALRAASLVAILGLVQTGLVTWALLSLLGFAGACATVIYSVAAPALVPALVPSRDLPSANARIELARTLAFAAGPACGGALVGWAGASTAFGVAAGLSLVAAFLLARLREPDRPPAPARHPLRDIGEGLSFAACHPLLRPVLMTQFIFNTAYFVILAVFVPYAARTLGLTAAGIGTVMSLVGVGMVAGALMAPWVMGRLPFGIVVGLGPLSGLLASLAIALTIWVPTPLLAALGMGLFGLGPILWTISTTTLRQTVTPPALLGRVSALSVLAQGARPLGALIGAALGGMFGAEACLVVGVVGFLAQALVIWFSPAVRLNRQPDLATA